MRVGRHPIPKKTPSTPTRHIFHKTAHLSLRSWSRRSKLPGGRVWCITSTYDAYSTPVTRTQLTCFSSKGSSTTWVNTSFRFQMIYDDISYTTRSASLYQYTAVYSSRHELRYWSWPYGLIYFEIKGQIVWSYKYRTVYFWWKVSLMTHFMWMGACGISVMTYFRILCGCQVELWWSVGGKGKIEK